MQTSIVGVRIVLCFVVHYFMSILVLQSSWWGWEGWLICLICLPGVSWWLSGSSSRCYADVCGLWLWYLLIILTYYFLLYVTEIHEYNGKSRHYNSFLKETRRWSTCNFSVIQSQTLHFTVNCDSVKPDILILHNKAAFILATRE